MLYAQIELGASLLNSFYLVQDDNHMVLLISCKYWAHGCTCSFPSHILVNLSYIYWILSWECPNASLMLHICSILVYIIAGNTFHSYIYPIVSFVLFVKLCDPFMHFTNRSCPIFPWIPGMFLCSQLMRIVVMSAWVFVSLRLDLPIKRYKPFC